MVKKLLSGGRECKKCTEAEALLREKGVFDRIDEVVWFVEDDPQSPGALLARELSMDRAPFFVIDRPGKPREAIDSVLRVYRML